MAGKGHDDTSGQDSAPRRNASIVVIAIALLLALGGWFGWRQFGATQEAPLPLWRDGVIVAVRNCEQPRSDTALRDCAALHCLQQVTRQLEYAVESKVSLGSVVARDDGGFEVSGRLVPFPLRADSPNAFTCVMPDHLRAAAEFHVASPAVTAPRR